MPGPAGHAWPQPGPPPAQAGRPALICVYCNRGREETDPGSGKTQRSTKFTGFGQRAMISWDEGCSWTYDYVLRKDGVDLATGLAPARPKVGGHDLVAGRNLLPMHFH